MKTAKRKTLLNTTMIVLVLLVLFVYSCLFFIQTISSNLYNGSKNNIIEATVHGSISIKNRINSDFNTLSAIATTLSQDMQRSKEDISNYLSHFIIDSGYHKLEVQYLDNSIINHEGNYYIDQTKQIPNESMNKQNHISSPFMDEITQKYIISFICPIIKADNVVGIVIGNKYLEAMHDSYHIDYYNGQGYSYIIDSKGNLILPSFPADDDLIFTNIISSLRDYPSNEENLDQFAADLATHGQGVAQFKINDNDKLIGYAPIDGVNDWYLLSVVPKNVIAIYQNGIIQSTLILCLIIFIILSIILTYVVKTNRINRKQIETLAFQDALTGADNLNKFKIEAAEQLRKKTPASYAVIQFDIDKFKYINDMFGYEEGNRILKYIASTLKSSLSDNEPFAREGNDHFVALLVYENDKHLIGRLDKISQKINLFQKMSNNHYEMILSFGIYILKDKSMGISTMIDRANIAQKTVKGKHQTSYAFYDDEIRNKIIQEKEIENDMIESLKNNEFIFYFQPKYELKSRKIVGAEALARWNHPKKGLLQPAAFIPLFEKNNFILNLDLFIFEQVCIKIKEWITKGYKPIPISVNLSRLHLYNANLTNMLNAIIVKHGIPACFIELELTESAFFDNMESLLSVMGNLRNIGFTISMDDFGSGYSSLNLLKDLPVDTLKIDRVFFKDTADTLRGQKVVSGIISIAKELHIKVISEGVETNEQSEFLERIDCDMAQGYFFARPMPIEDFERMAFCHII